MMSVPRLVVANFVNFFATMRAVRIYGMHLITGKALVWDKTSHSYPVPIVPGDYGFLPDAAQPTMVPARTPALPLRPQLVPSARPLPERTTPPAPRPSQPTQVRSQGSFKQG